MRNSLLSSICVICALCGYTVFAAHEYGKTVYYGDVTTGTWPTLNASSNAVYTAAGTYTNGLYTNYYRLSYTNLLGRGPLAPVTIAFTGNPSTIPGTNTVTFIYTNILGHGVWVPTVVGYTGDTNTIVGTNTVSLTWQIQGGAAGYIIERSLDAGTSWTNWISTGPTSTNFYDYGTNTWTASTFTNLYSPIPPPSVPQGGSSTGGVTMAEVEARVGVATQGMLTAETETLSALLTRDNNMGLHPVSNAGSLYYANGSVLGPTALSDADGHGVLTWGGMQGPTRLLRGTNQVAMNFSLGKWHTADIADYEQAEASNNAVVLQQFTENRSYWGRNEAGEITLKAATNRLSDVYWTTNSAGEVILQ